MTKTVRLAQLYIDFIKSIKNLTNKKWPTISGEMFCCVDRTNLDIEDIGVRNEDIGADPKNVPLYKTKLDPSGGKTTNFNHHYKTVSVNCYDLKDENDTIEMPVKIADQLIRAGFVEEVI